MNGHEAINGFTVKEASCEPAPVMTDTSLTSSDDVDNSDRLAGSQPSSTDLVYDLQIHNQTLLWKALPKPSYNNQVSVYGHPAKQMRTLYFCPVVSFYLSFYLFFIPRLISAVGDWMSTILRYMV